MKQGLIQRLIQGFLQLIVPSGPYFASLLVKRSVSEYGKVLAVVESSVAKYQVLASMGRVFPVPLEKRPVEKKRSTLPSFSNVPRPERSPWAAYQLTPHKYHCPKRLVNPKGRQRYKRLGRPGDKYIIFFIDDDSNKIRSRLVPLLPCERLDRCESSSTTATIHNNNHHQSSSHCFVGRKGFLQFVQMVLGISILHDD